MKKLLTVIAAFTMIATTSIVNAQGVNFGAAIGAGYPKALETVTLDAALNLNFGINKFFALGVEGAFDWMSKDIAMGDKVSFGSSGLPASTAYTENIYTIPVLANAIIMIPMGEGDEAGVTPFVSIGAGYGWAFYRSDLSDAEEYNFKGIVWQAKGGALISLGEGSDGMKLLVEGGWRGTTLKEEIKTVTVELKMDGAFARVGVVFALSGGDE